MRASLLLAILALTGLLAGCLTPANVSGNYTPKLLIEADRITFSDRVNLTVTLIVEKPWTFTTRGCGHPLVHVNASPPGRIPLYGYTDVEDPYRGKYCTVMVQESTLQPGTYKRNVSWNGHTASSPPNPHAGDRLPSGNYTVHAYVDSIDLRPSADIVLHLV